MASIKVNNLSEFEFNGSELFQDSESFLNELTDNELKNNKGGILTIIITTVLIPIPAY